MTQLLKTNINQTKGRLLGLYSLILLMLMAFAPHTHAEEAKRIVKWKDDKGVTHYGDSIPAQYSNRENSLINQQGITVKHNKPITYQDESLSLAKIEQDKKDKALLSAFTNESEIDLARDRNLQLDQVTLEGLQLQKTNSQKRLTENQKYANGFVKNKKAVPADLATDIKTNQAEVLKIDQQIVERKTTMDATRKRFDDDKKRYILLRSRANGSATPTEFPSATKP
jgi:hypothetical protein